METDTNTPRESLATGSNASARWQPLVDLGREHPQALDFARAELDLDFAEELRARVLRDALDSAEILSALRQVPEDDPARAALVLALAWTPDSTRQAEATLLELALAPGRQANNAEQCALAAVRALGLRAQERALLLCAAAPLAQLTESQADLQSVRVWLALRELESAPPLTEHYLTAEPRPLRVQEELWAVVVRTGDPLWSEEALARAQEGEEAALAGVAVMQDSAQLPALLACHAQAEGWVAMATQKALLQYTEAEARQRWMADLQVPARREGMLEALRSWRALPQRKRQLQNMLACLASLEPDPAAQAELARTLRSEARLYALRNDSQADRELAADCLRAAALVLR